MGHLTAEKDVEIQEGSALPDFPRAGAGPSHEVQQAFLAVLARRQRGVKREAAVHARLCLGPVEPLRLRIDVKRTDESSVGVGSVRAQLGGSHGGVNLVPGALKKRGQPRPVNEKEHQLEAHALSACFACFKPRSRACSKGEVEA